MKSDETALEFHGKKRIILFCTDYNHYKMRKAT